MFLNIILLFLYPLQINSTLTVIYENDAIVLLFNNMITINDGVIFE